MKIGIDIDGVILDYERVLKTYGDLYDFIELKKDGIVIMIPSGIVSNNYLFANLGPRIPVKISLTGEFESCISTKVEEYGLNNALISIYINIKATEQITMPFITEKVEIENQIPLSIYVVNGKIPEYYINGFDRTSNIYRSNN